MLLWLIHSPKTVSILTQMVLSSLGLPSAASSPVCEFWVYLVVDDGYTLCVCVSAWNAAESWEATEPLPSPPWGDRGAGVMLLVRTLGTSLR